MIQAVRFRAKIIHVGTSAGIIIPKEILKQRNLKIGEKVNFSIVNTEKERLELIDKALGSMPGLGPFVRDKSDRMERLFPSPNLKDKKSVKQIS